MEEEVLEQQGQSSDNLISSSSSYLGTAHPNTPKLIIPLPPSAAIKLDFHIYSAHFLPKPKGKEGDIENICPFVIITMHDGVAIKRSSTSVRNDGFAPCFHEKLPFLVAWPEVTLATFEVYHQDTKFGRKKFIAAAAFPVHGIRSGLRWVPLWDYRRNSIENCGLLVEVTKFPEEEQRVARVETDFSIFGQDRPIEEVKEPDHFYSSELSEMGAPCTPLASGIPRLGSITSEDSTAVQSEISVSPLGQPGRRIEDWDFLKNIDCDHPRLQAVPARPPVLEDEEPAETALSKCLACGCGTKPLPRTSDLPYNESTGLLNL